MHFKYLHLFILENDITDCVSLINEVCVEAKSAGDRELQAEFLMQAVIIGLQEKHLKADIIKNLQVWRKPNSHWYLPEDSG